MSSYASGNLVIKCLMTVNEQLTYILRGYIQGTAPPVLCSEWQNLNCTGRNSGTEPYVVGHHHQLPAHVNVVNLCKKKYQSFQKGQRICAEFKLVCPLSELRQDSDVVQQAIDFRFGWFWNL